MATIQDPAIRDALRSLGCLTEDRLDSSAFAKLLAERLEAHHVAGTLADVPTVETTIGQLVADVVGTTDDQLIDLARPLLGTGAKSPVQRALTNGYMLCGGRARINLDIAGEHKSTSIATRFLSGDENVIVRHVLEPRQRRASSFVKGTLELTDTIEQRQPTMTARLGTFIEQLTITWEKELGPGEAA
jgi:hypothetical protein